jgi:hypothetical protein
MRRLARRSEVVVFTVRGGDPRFRHQHTQPRSGAVDQALSGFEELLRKYPSSPLSQTARVRKFRLLAKSGRKSQAAAEALRYLNSYPTGFAEREAEAIARGEATPGDTPSDEPGSP